MSWLYWTDILEAHVIGFHRLSEGSQFREIKKWRGRLSDARKLLNEKGYFLMAAGSSKTRKLKLATDHPEDIAFANSMIEHSKSLSAAEKERQKRRIAIMLNEEKLPPHERKKKKTSSRGVIRSRKI